MLGVLYVELFQFWQIVDRAWLELLKLTAFVVFLLLVGTLPYVDNMAHIGKSSKLCIAYVVIMPNNRWTFVWSANSYCICALHHFWEVGCFSKEDFAGDMCASGDYYVFGWFPYILPPS